MASKPLSLAEAIALLREVAAAGKTSTRRNAKSVTLSADLSARVHDAVGRFDSAALVAEPGGHSRPTSYIERFGDALTLLCGARPSDDLIKAWLLDEPDADLMQSFASEHGPSWAQGLGILDAARAIADQPTEDEAHETFEDFVGLHQAS